MTEKIILTKGYERDLSLVLEDLWINSFVKEIEKKNGFKNPYPPTYFLYVTKENMQIWEHKKALDYFLNWLLDKTSKGPVFMENVLKEYEPILEKIKKYWAKGSTTDKAELIKYVELTKEGVVLFCLWYYAGLDERTPKETLDLVLKVREKDEFFGANATFINECMAALGVRSDLANLVLPKEFPDVPSNEVLVERARTGVISIDGGEYFFSTIEEFAKNHEEYIFEGLGDVVPEVSIIKGQTAFKGKVTGRVQIIKNRLQMDSVKEGDIIVSPMTTPDFLPAMKRAAGFVTDEGGITCHAAIVAREMKKPCIIGTKIATKVFKTGDMVEVDADNGVVMLVQN